MPKAPHEISHDLFPPRPHPSVSRRLTSATTLAWRQTRLRANFDAHAHQSVAAAPASGRKPRSEFSHYLPRLKREFYQADAVVFWTMPIDHRQRGWLTDSFHATFRELQLHAAAREGW
jgi:hypothetical protein